MDAERLILEKDASGNLKRVPKLPPNKQLEAFFLVLGIQPKVVSKVVRLILILLEKSRYWVISLTLFQKLIGIFLNDRTRCAHMTVVGQ